MKRQTLQQKYCIATKLGPTQLTLPACVGTEKLPGTDANQKEKGDVCTRTRFNISQLQKAFKK